MSRKIIYIALLLLTSTSFAAVPSSDWPVYGGDSGSTHYSPLTQITAKNVHRLNTAWVYHTGDLSNGEKGIEQTDFQATPVLWEKTLYFCTPFNRIVALDAKTGTLRWQYRSDLDLSRKYITHFRCRGVALWEDEKQPRNTPCQARVFEGMLDGKVIAVDARTGQLCQQFGDHGHVNVNQQPNANKTLMMVIGSAPVVYKDLVIVGCSLNDNQYTDSPHGIVNAFDARTGQLKWQWDPIPPALAKTAGASDVWAPFSLDVKRGLLFLPTTSPSTDYYGGARTQPVQYESSVVALRADTGRPVWHFQTVHHGLWDYDLPSAPALIDVKRNGKIIPAVAQATKTNLLFILDRDTGKPLFPVEERPVPSSDVPGEVTSPTQPFPVLPKPLNRMTMTAQDAFGLFYLDTLWCRHKIKQLSNKGVFTPPSLQGFLELPGPVGGNNWGGVGFDPHSNLLIVNTTNLAYAIYLFPREQFKKAKSTYLHDEISPMHGTPYAMRRTPLLSPLGVPCTPPPWGKLSAVDVNTGEIRWEIPFGRVRKGWWMTPKRWGSPTLGGPLVTKSGLIFIGATIDNRFHAYDVHTGKLLWETDLPDDGIATPMTYTIDGKQFVVIAAGGGRISRRAGDALVAFALPGKG